MLEQFRNLFDMVDQANTGRISYVLLACVVQLRDLFCLCFVLYTVAFSPRSSTACHALLMPRRAAPSPTSGLH